LTEKARQTILRKVYVDRCGQFHAQASIKGVQFCISFALHPLLSQSKNKSDMRGNITMATSTHCKVKSENHF